MRKKDLFLLNVDHIGGEMLRMLASSVVDPGIMLGHVIPKTIKLVFAVSPLITQL